MCSWPARQLETPPSAVVAEGIVLSSVVRCWVGVVNSYWLASAATAWVGELGLTQPAEVTRPSMLLTELGLRPATIGGRR